MAQARIEFNNVTGLRAEALGEPGKRTFRILVDSGESTAVLWLEKEQLFQLALASDQLLATLTDEDKAAATAPAPATEFQPPTHLDFKIGKMVLGHERSTGRIIIDAHEEDDEESPVLKVSLEQGQIEEFSEEAMRVCAAGRPLCPLCGGPIDPTGHICARVNGHRTFEDL